MGSDLRRRTGPTVGPVEPRPSDALPPDRQIEPLPHRRLPSASDRATASATGHPTPSHGHLPRRRPRRRSPSLIALAVAFAARLRRSPSPLPLASWSTGAPWPHPSYAAKKWTQQTKIDPAGPWSSSPLQLRREATAVVSCINGELPIRAFCRGL